MEFLRAGTIYSSVQKNRLDAQGVTNVAYVWQSTGWVSTPTQLMEWYPGDDYVDW